MNSYIDRVASLPGASWSPLQIDVLQCLFLYGVMIAGSYWLLTKNKSACYLSLAGLLFFCFIRSLSFMHQEQQNLLIVYQVPKSTAIDLVCGRKARFIGDPQTMTNPALRRRYLQPTRTRWRTQLQSTLPAVFTNNECIQFRGKRIVLLHSTHGQTSGGAAVPIDLLIICGPVRSSIQLLSNTFRCRQVVLSSAVSSFQAKQWKNDCDALHIPCHDVNTFGAFVMNCR